MYSSLSPSGIPICQSLNGRIRRETSPPYSSRHVSPLHTFYKYFAHSLNWILSCPCEYHIPLFFRPLLRPGSSRSPPTTAGITAQSTIICLLHSLFHPTVRPCTLRMRLYSARIIPLKEGLQHMLPNHTFRLRPTIGIFTPGQLCNNQPRGDLAC